jgi:short-subunit dehydrogenase
LTRRKVVLVTGASAGIGGAVAREAARRGYRLALVARRRDRLEEVASDARSSGAEVLTVGADLADSDSLVRVINETTERFGGLDVLVNNAGFGLPNLFEDSDPDEIRRQLEVNLVAPLLLARHALPTLLERRGVIVNVGSAITCIPNSALGAYGATKAGLAYWSSALRRELLHKGVSVCLVEPGPVHTEFFDALTLLTSHAGYHPMLDAPAPWMSADVQVVARRIVDLFERPRRLVSVPRRFVWPYRALGGFFRLFPALGDRAVSSIVAHYARKEARTRSDQTVSNAVRTGHPSQEELR